MQNDDPPEVLRAILENECRELGLAASILTTTNRVGVRFVDQFGSRGLDLDQLFEAELTAQGMEFDASGIVARADVLVSPRVSDAARAALRRTRGRMVDDNAWIRGGFAWPFEVTDGVVRERGLATYRAPARAAAWVDVLVDRVRIRIPEGDCGDVVSAGMWAPTALTGDFDVAVDYRLELWHAGPREACLGLFAVAPDGTVRAYAQRVSRAGAPHYVTADLDGGPGSANVPLHRDTGRLRIQRDGALVHAWHEDEGERRWLGRLRVPLDSALIVGSKVWAVGVCGPLEAELTRFTLRATSRPTQDPVPPERPDPRDER